MNVIGGIEELYRVDGAARVEQLRAFDQPRPKLAGPKIVERGIISEHEAIETEGPTLEFHDELRIVSMSNGAFRASLLLQRSPVLGDNSMVRLSETIQGLILTRLDMSGDEVERYELRPAPTVAPDKLAERSKDIFETLALLDSDRVLQLAAGQEGRPDSALEDQLSRDLLETRRAFSSDPGRSLNDEEISLLREFAMMTIVDYARGSGLKVIPLRKRVVGEEEHFLEEEPDVIAGSPSISMPATIETVTITAAADPALKFQALPSTAISVGGQTRAEQLDQVIDLIKIYGPRVRTSTRLDVREAEMICERLRASDARFADIYAPDIFRVYDVWSPKNKYEGRQYRHIMLEQRLELLKHEVGLGDIDIHTVEGLSAIRAHCNTINLYKQPNKYGTTLDGLQYAGRNDRFPPIVDMIEKDPKFEAVRAIARFREWDLPVTRGLHTEARTPTKLLREAVYEAYEIVCRKLGVEPNDPQQYSRVSGAMIANAHDENYIKTPFGRSLVALLRNNYGQGGVKERMEAAIKDAFEQRKDPLGVGPKTVKYQSPF